MDNKKKLLALEESFKAAVSALSTVEWRANRRLQRKTKEVKEMIKKIVTVVKERSPTNSSTGTGDNHE